MQNTEESKDAQLAVAQSRGLELRSFSDLSQFAQSIAKSGLAPKGLEKPEAIIVAIQLGMELGLTPLSALQSIAVINGRPGIYGDAALALVRGSGMCVLYDQHLDGEGESRRAVVTSKRKGGDEITTTFSVQDAKKAGLWGKSGPWTQYPDRMLLFRARGFNLRDNFGDVLKGFKTTEELADRPAVATVVDPNPNQQPAPHEEESTIEGVVEKSIYEDDKKRFKAKCGDKTVWTLDPQLGQELLEANGLRVLLKVKNGSRPSVVKLLDLQPVPSDETREAVEQEPDDIPF